MKVIDLKSEKYRIEYLLKKLDAINNTLCASDVSTYIEVKATV